MSTDLAIAAVTATIRQILADQTVDKWGPGVLGGDLTKEFVVTHLLPHKVRDLHASRNVINVFLYRTELNAAWRNMPLPSQTKPGESGAPPLALNLEYLVTAYGEDDREDAAHFFLGQAMRALHDSAILPRAKFNDVLPKALVQRQIEQVTITPKPLSVEEMSKLWGIFQTQFRISAAYLVTVLLIDSRTATKSAPPVLTRGPDDSGITALASPPAALDSVRAETGFPAVRLGESLVVTGEHLDGGGLSALVRHPVFPTPVELPVTPVDGRHVQVAIPGGAGSSAAWPAGLYSLALLVQRPGMTSWTTNGVPFALAPNITLSPTAHTNDGNPFEVTLTVTPQVRESQQAIVILGGDQLAVTSNTTPNDPDAPTTITFDAPPVDGRHLVRLRVDGVDSIPVTKVDDVLQFDGSQIIEVTT